jgi:hypothetical protein
MRGGGGRGGRREGMTNPMEGLYRGMGMFWIKREVIFIHYKQWMKWTNCLFEVVKLCFGHLIPSFLHVLCINLQLASEQKGAKL